MNSSKLKAGGSHANSDRVQESEGLQLSEEANDIRSTE